MKLLIKLQKSQENNLEADESEVEIPRERCISPEKRQKIIENLRLM